jgi:hypothetical protein
MREEEFNKIVEHVKDKLITKTLDKKGGEYSKDGDVLANIKRMAAIQGCTPEKALTGAWAKHVASILNMVDKLEQSNIEYSLKVWDEKIGDAINYLIFLRALAEERLVKVTYTGRPE